MRTPYWLRHCCRNQQATVWTQELSHTHQLQYQLVTVQVNILRYSKVAEESFRRQPLIAAFCCNELCHNKLYHWIHSPSHHLLLCMVLPTLPRQRLEQGQELRSLIFMALFTIITRFSKWLHYNAVVMEFYSCSMPIYRATVPIHC